MLVVYVSQHRAVYQSLSSSFESERFHPVLGSRTLFYEKYDRPFFGSTGPYVRA